MCIRDSFQGMGADAAAFLVEQLRLWDSPSRFPWNRLNKIQRPNFLATAIRNQINGLRARDDQRFTRATDRLARLGSKLASCLLYTSDAADERSSVDLG